MSLDEPKADLGLFVPRYRVEECLAEIRECLEKGWTGLGFKTLAFEEAWKEYTELPFAHFVSSATAGLHLAVRILKERENWRDGDEVITTPLTFISTSHVLLYERLRPVFADVDKHLCLSPESVLDRITPRTKAVMFVGLGGNAGQLAEMADLCRSHGLRLILDAAHMAGTRIDGLHVGQEADAAVFSFHAVKNLPTADSGMLCFQKKSFDRAARKWSWMGISKDTYARTLSKKSSYRWRYDVEHVGFKYHGNSIMAALGLVALRYLEEDNGYRRHLAGLYEQAFESFDEVETVSVSSGCVSSRHLFQVLVENRDELVSKLNRQGIFPGVHYRLHTEYPMYGADEEDCPRAKAAADRIVSLPLHLDMTGDDVSRVASVVAKSAAPALREPR